MLHIEDLHIHYGKNHVVRGISLDVAAGSVAALIGPNSAGKTTTLRTIAGLKHQTSGRIILDSVDIDAFSTVKRVEHGLVLVPEGRKVFTEFSVRENLLMGAYHRSDRNSLDRDFERVYTMFPKLRQRSGQRAGSMSGGEQQMLAIGRGLMAKPRCLLLDEPTLGIAPIVIEEIEEALRALARDGLTILISEQNAAMALRVADTASILEAGAISLADSAARLQESPAIQALYLGA